MGVDSPKAHVPSSGQPVLGKEKTEASCIRVASCVTFRLYREEGTCDTAMCVAADRIQECKLELGTLAVVPGKTHSRNGSVCSHMGAIGHSAHTHPLQVTPVLFSRFMMPFLPAVSKAAKKAVLWPDGQPTLPTQHGWKVSTTGPGAPKHLQVLPEGGSGFPFLET